MNFNCSNHNYKQEINLYIIYHNKQTRYIQCIYRVCWLQNVGNLKVKHIFNSTRLKYCQKKVFTIYIHEQKFYEYRKLYLNYKQGSTYVTFWKMKKTTIKCSALLALRVYLNILIITHDLN